MIAIIDIVAMIRINKIKCKESQYLPNLIIKITTKN